MKEKADIPDEVKEITADDLRGLLARINQSSLTDRDKRLIFAFITTVTTLRVMVERRTIGLKSFLRKVFGLKTEKHRRRGGGPPPPAPPSAGGPSPPPPGGDTARPANDGGAGAASSAGGAPAGNPQRKGGKGRNGRGDYPGAIHQRITHVTLGVGSPCPVCRDGTLSRLDDDGVAYRWTGSLPLVLTIYDLERLICHSCKTTFTAPIPGETLDVSKLDPSLPPAVARVKERAATPEAAASLACLRFELGVPHYRQADAQAAQGVPLPPSTQVKMMEPLRAPAEAIFSAFERLGGNGKMVIPDDTGMRVLDIERGKVHPPATTSTATEATAAKKPELLRPKKAGVEPAKGPRATTSAVVVKVGDHTVCLHYTGFEQAGTNLAKILVHRSSDAGPPIEMCDALAANVPKGFVTLLGNCLDHARRQFYDFEAYYPDAVNEVLTRLGLVYAFDAEAKRLDLSDDERLTWHQMHSAQEMGELWLWARSTKDSNDVMPNSPLIRPINYLLRHWDELTLFLRMPGAPISSAEVERLIKRCIRHRKNSLQYKTLRGARFGDLMMSLIQTCRYAKESAHAYLSALVRYAANVAQDPERWLPWNYREAVATQS